MLRECAAGCLGALQTTSHQNVRLKLRLPEGSPAKFVKISGALQITKRATGRDAEAALGDLRFGDKRGTQNSGLERLLLVANHDQISWCSLSSLQTQARRTSSRKTLGRPSSLDWKPWEALWTKTIHVHSASRRCR